MKRGVLFYCFSCDWKTTDKIIRFSDDNLRTKDGFVEKVKLKNQALIQQIAKVQSQLHSKEEMGDVLNGIDFDQLKIENRQFLDKIELKNRELLRLKLTAGKTVHTLNHYKVECSTHFWRDYKMFLKIISGWILKLILEARVTLNWLTNLMLQIKSMFLFLSSFWKNPSF